MVEVYVDKLTAPLLNTGTDRLEDILVLHLAGGKDLFVSFTTRLMPGPTYCHRGEGGSGDPTPLWKKRCVHKLYW